MSKAVPITAHFSLALACTWAVCAAARQQVEEIVDSIFSQETLRQISRMESAERDNLISMLEPGIAAELIEEAPAELAASLMQDLDSSVAAKIMAELHTHTQADIVQELEQADSEAILSEMDSESAEGVRMLSRYDPDTSGGLMELEVFKFPIGETVGTVLKRVIEGDEAFEGYRGQHPYIIDITGKDIAGMMIAILVKLQPGKTKTLGKG